MRMPKRIHGFHELHEDAYELALAICSIEERMRRIDFTLESLVDAVERVADALEVTNGTKESEDEND